jgi:hypothetical protein
MATNLVNMQLPKRDKSYEEKMYTTMASSDDDSPKYPWGLCITLDDQSLKQLGITKMPDVDDVLTITAKAEITSVSANQSQDGTHRSLSLQITDMAIGSTSSDEPDAD